MYIMYIRKKNIARTLARDKVILDSFFQTCKMKFCKETL